MITLGTGIGTAAMIGGALLYGKHFQASNQGGHSPILFNGRNCIMSDNSITVQTAKETVPSTQWWIRNL
jgi:predicted NBD/HSP70 family sugar kinase